MKQPLIFNRQRFAIHDGDGIRTTLFFKGCGLKCKWCHNPESQSFLKQRRYDKEKCVGCGNCVQNCTNNALKILDDEIHYNEKNCTKCGACETYCYQSATEWLGETYDIETLVSWILKDQQLYDTSGGGVTLSGGEVMAQDMDYIETLCKALKKWGINITVDTCGFAPTSHFKKLMPYVDTFLYDLKSLDQTRYQRHIGTGLSLTLEHLLLLNEHGKDIRLRLPIIGGFNEDGASVTAIITFLTDHQIRPKAIHLLPYHAYGCDKYGRIGRTYEGTQYWTPTQAQLDEIREHFIKSGFNAVHIGG